MEVFPGIKGEEMIVIFFKYALPAEPSTLITSVQSVSFSSRGRNKTRIYKRLSRLTDQFCQFVIIIK